MLTINEAGSHISTKGTDLSSEIILACDFNLLGCHDIAKWGRVTAISERVNLFYPRRG